jgi:hypothetical protein
MRLIIVVLIICISNISFWDAFASDLSVRQVQISKTIDTPRVASQEKMIHRLIGSSIFLDYTNQALSIVIDHTLVEPRGRMKWRSISLSSSIVRDSEFLKLFVHEFWHFFDIYVLNSSWGKDSSLDFYNISWQSSVKKAWQGQKNFVSGYAATNQYEDFAESFVFYIFHNRVFEELALRDETLRQKYLFFQNTVFPSGAFLDTDYSLWKIPSYTWDTTKLPISLQKYLYSLN